ncbi:MAG: hypothetical protein IPL59_08255 [Candidatus Competibacteraceae bacterium]|nr:hypothetical protein [Candidatus Competibacteraceae bacterium]
MSELKSTLAMADAKISINRFHSIGIERGLYRQQFSGDSYLPWFLSSHARNFLRPGIEGLLRVGPGREGFSVI